MTKLKQCDYCGKKVKKGISSAEGGTKRICVPCSIDKAERDKRFGGRRYDQPRKRGRF